MISEERLLAKELIEKIVEKTNKGKIPWEVKGKISFSGYFGTSDHPYVARCDSMNLSLRRSGGGYSRYLEISNGKIKTELKSDDRLYSKTLKVLFETVDNLIRKSWEKEIRERKKAETKSLINQLARVLN